MQGETFARQSVYLEETRMKKIAFVIAMLACVTCGAKESRKVTRLRKEVKKLVSERDVMRNKIKMIATKVTVQRAEIKNTRNERKPLVEERNSKRSRIDKIAAEVIMPDSPKDSLTKERNALKKEEGQLKGRIDNLATKIAKYNTEIENLKKERETLRERIMAKNDIISAKRDLLTTLE